MFLVIIRKLFKMKYLKETLKDMNSKIMFASSIFITFVFKSF